MKEVLAYLTLLYVVLGIAVILLTAVFTTFNWRRFGIFVVVLGLLTLTLTPAPVLVIVPNLDDETVWKETYSLAITAVVLGISCLFCVWANTLRVLALGLGQDLTTGVARALNESRD